MIYWSRYDARLAFSRVNLRSGNRVESSSACLGVQDERPWSRRGNDTWTRYLRDRNELRMLMVNEQWARSVAQFAQVQSSHGRRVLATLACSFAIRLPELRLSWSRKRALWERNPFFLWIGVPFQETLRRYTHLYVNSLNSVFGKLFHETRN